MTATTGSVRLLDVVPELAAHLRPEERADALVRLVAPTTLVPPGSWSLHTEARRARPFAFIIVRGVLLHEVVVAGRRALQLLGPGDIVLPEEPEAETLDAPVTWTAASESCLALLDDRLQPVIALWPALGIGLVERAGRQLRRVAIQAAIAQLPRVEDRLEATFWDLADRWGRVTTTGIHIPLQLTHATLGSLVGARRSTVTLALRALAQRGIVARHPDRTWMLVAGAPSAAFEARGRRPVPEPRFSSEPPPPVSRLEGDPRPLVG
jgi:CRP-like cAMP-binding protein